jgi:hypothetical protein
MMFHEVARQVFRLEWCRDRSIAVWTSIGASPWSGQDVRFFAERQRPIHFSLLAVVAAFSRRFGHATELLVFRRFGAIIFSWTHWFPPAGRGRERAACLSATDGPDFFLILVVRLRWGRPIPIASLIRTPRNLPTTSASDQLWLDVLGKESPATGGPAAGLRNHKPRQYIRGRGGMAMALPVRRRADSRRRR